MSGIVTGVDGQLDIAGPLAVAHSALSDASPSDGPAHRDDRTFRNCRMKSRHRSDQRHKRPTKLTYLTASSYVDGFTPGESLSLQGDLDLDVAGRDVLIVDDIIDTGRTLKELSALVAA